MAPRVKSQLEKGERKMKKVFVSLTLALMLVAVMAAPVMAAEESKTASVTVTETISFTVTDAGAAGINFGSLNQGTTDNPEAAQNGAGAVTLAVGAETNVDCNVQIKASGDFSDGATHTIALSNAHWDTDNAVAGYTAMTTDYATIGTSTAGTAYSQDVWHWLSIPGGQVAGTYTSTYYYQAVAQ
jgi:spore coat protein U-like protein